MNGSVRKGHVLKLIGVLPLALEQPVANKLSPLVKISLFNNSSKIQLIASFDVCRALSPTNF